MSGAQPLQFVPALPAEESARANLYGLIARLFYAPPDENLISELLAVGDAGEDRGPLGVAWRALLEACSAVSPAAVRDEHLVLFVGTGKSEVTPYLSHYLVRHSSDSPLVGLRQLLDSWGIARREGVAEYEDHIAGVCETMRFAIAVQHRSDEEQKAFFERFLYRGGMAFCDAVSASPKAVFYRRVAVFARAFLELEHEAFGML